jgi:hypothetical protein
MPADGPAADIERCEHGSKFKAVNTRDNNFTGNNVERRRAQLEESVARYLAQLATADRHEPSDELAAKTEHLKEKLFKLGNEMQRLAAMEKLLLASPDQQISLTDPNSRSMATSGRGSGVVGYNVQVAKGMILHRYRTNACQHCTIKRECTAACFETPLVDGDMLCHPAVARRPSKKAITPTLLWQIYSRRCSLQIHLRQCGHRCFGGSPISSRMA